MSLGRPRDTTEDNEVLPHILILAVMPLTSQSASPLEADQLNNRSPNITTHATDDDTYRHSTPSTTSRRLMRLSVSKSTVPYAIDDSDASATPTLTA
jgi:hypothetical protein